MENSVRPTNLVGLRIGIAVLMLAASQSLAHGQESALVYPVDIVANDNGWVIADFKAHGLLAVDEDGNVATIVQGPGLPRTPLYGTRAILEAPDGDGWLVADPGTFALYRVSRDGTLSTITTDLDIPQGLARFDDNSVLVSDLRSGIGAVMHVTLEALSPFLPRSIAQKESFKMARTVSLLSLTVTGLYTGWIVTEV